jgi:hypothetical protein
VIDDPARERGDTRVQAAAVGHVAWLAPVRVWHRPSFLGIEHVDPSHPAMFAGNHTLYGVQDVPHILYELRRVHGVFPRSLADRAHFALPV